MERTLAGKTIVVTGATGGIGLETARALARLGARVAVVGRDRSRGERALRAVEADAAGARPALFLADLARLADVRRLAEELAAALPRIDVLVNNAGAHHATRKASEDGLELTFAVNHLATYLLTRLLLPRLEASAPARVVTVASEAHRMGTIDWTDLQSERRYAAMRAYGISKLMNVMFAAALARRTSGRGVTSNSLHPGVVATGFGRNDPGWLRVAVALAAPFLRTPEKGARTSVFLAASPEVAAVTGRYFKDTRPAEPAATARDEASQERLWEISARLSGLTP
jgi:NAD(P)-dependent dehydrogenase (short-subunit alcohol dehydrogenase family)